MSSRTKIGNSHNLLEVSEKSPTLTECPLLNHIHYDTPVYTLQTRLSQPRNTEARRVVLPDGMHKKDHRKLKGVS